MIGQAPTSGPSENSTAEAGFAPLRWWETRWAIAALIALSALPLLWPDIPPLVDLPGHMGRYKIQLDLAGSPDLQRFYTFHWALIGNLGVDLLIVPLSKLFGLELATRLVILAIPPLTVGGFLWVAREIHGRVPPTALFAIPFAYGHPFIFGFVNFALSMALAFLAFALWLRLARSGRLRLRAILFVPISALLWLCHVYGWGTLGVLAFSAELIRQRDDGRTWIAAGFQAGVQCLALALPLLLMLVWRQGGAAGGTGDWFNWRTKYLWLTMALRDRWQGLDLASVAGVLLVLGIAVRSPRLGFSRSLATALLIFGLVYIFSPRIIFGSAYADMRLVPYLLAIGLIAIHLNAGAGARFAGTLAAAALMFAVLRIGSNAWSFWLYDQDYDRELAAVDHIPRGARLVSFVGTPCATPWRMSRLHHLPALALVRREAFSNDQWSMAGAQLVTAIYPAETTFRHDPSQFVVAPDCRSAEWRTLDDTLRALPRDSFDYVWLIRPPPHDQRLLAGLTPLWRNGTSALYRVTDRTPHRPSPSVR